MSLPVQLEALRVTVPDGPADGAPRNERTIRQVSDGLNVPAPTIRAWERRYGVPVADRSRGGHRRYTGDQVDQLRRMRDLIAQGRRPADAAALVRAGYATSPGPLVTAFVEGTRDLAPDRITQTLTVARQTLGLDRTVDEVLLPAMREIGERWYAGRMDVSHEHVATNATSAWLSALPVEVPLRPGPPIILSCGPEDNHTLGLEAIGALLRDRGWDCRLLGARIPAASLAHAIQETSAVAVVLVCHLPAGRVAAIESLRVVEVRRTHLFYAGGAFASDPARHDVPGRYLGTNLSRAADLVTETITATKAGSAR
jgi:DNA-binding transcriptional MerR regulator